jgi:transposase
MVAATARLIPPSLRVDALLVADDGLTIRVAADATAARCPLCGEPADRVHSRAARTLADLPWAGVAVRLCVQVRKFFCDNPSCPRRIFRERLAGVAQASARRTERQRAALLDLAVALGGEAGARMAAKRGMRVSPDTLLRLIRRAPEVERPAPTMIGVDAWAIHKGLTYGTILVDLERHCPVDLLPDRSSASLAEWLRAHPGVEVIARDRAGAYAEGARDGAPEAVQVADRWHLVDNLADALEDFFRSKGPCLAAATAALTALSAPAAGTELGAAAMPAPTDAIYQGKRRYPRPPLARARQAAAAAAGVARRRAKYEQARALHARGATNAAIARTVGIGYRTVYRYLHQDPPVRKRRADDGQRRVITPFEPYLLKRWAEGCQTATVLWREIRAQGFAYSLTNVQRFVAGLRREGPPPAGRPRTALTQPHGPPPRQVAARLLRRPEKRTDEQRAYLRQLCVADPAVATATDLVADFLGMLRRREGERLPAWLEAAEASGIGDLARFARKLRTDLAAVQAGLTLRQGNGQTEGQVNRLKLLKRQGYGRAKVDLRRKRVLARTGRPGPSAGSLTDPTPRSPDVRESRLPAKRRGGSMADGLTVRRLWR